MPWRRTTCIPKPWNFTNESRFQESFTNFELYVSRCGDDYVWRLASTPVCTRVTARLGFTSISGFSINPAYIADDFTAPPPSVPAAVGYVHNTHWAGHCCDSVLTTETGTRRITRWYRTETDSMMKMHRPKDSLPMKSNQPTNLFLPDAPMLWYRWIWSFSHGIVLYS